MKQRNNKFWKKYSNSLREIIYSNLMIKSYTSRKFSSYMGEGEVGRKNFSCWVSDFFSEKMVRLCVNDKKRSFRHLLSKRVNRTGSIFVRCVFSKWVSNLEVTP